MTDYCPYCTSDNLEEFSNGDCQCLDCKHCWNEDDEEQDNE